MQILISLCLTSVNAIPDDRTYSDSFIFINADPQWWNPTYAHQKLRDIRLFTKSFISLYFNKNIKALRYGQTLEKLLVDTQEDMQRGSKRCTKKYIRRKKNRNRREEAKHNHSTTVATGRWIAKAFRDDLFLLFFQYARWVREEYYRNCPKSGLRLVM